MEKLSHEKLQNFLEEVISEMKDVNKFYKSKGKKELPIAELIAPLYMDLKRNVQRYAEFINDLEKCDESAPILIDYGNDNECGEVTFRLNMLKRYSQYGDTYCPLKYKYELRFYKKKNREDQYIKFYIFALYKTYCISADSWNYSEQEYEKFVEDFNNIENV